jgi:hypothetical protein
VRRTANLLDAVSRHDLKLTRSLRRGLFALHRSLSLQKVRNFDSIEAFHFADINPASPIVTKICLPRTVLIPANSLPVSVLRLNS